VEGERLSDDCLIARIAARDAQALATLYERYSPAVMAVAMLVTSAPETAEDVVVQTFWDLWQQKGALPVEGPTIRNRLMLYTRRLAQEALVQALNG
jgi:RNA polymerase sigma-70 factor (ECF subfamily)